MSLFDAFDEKEKSPDKGWSHSCLFSNSDSVGEKEIPTSSSDTDQQLDIELQEETVVIDSSVEEIPQEVSSEGTHQVCEGQVTSCEEAIGVEAEGGGPVEIVDGTSQESNEGEVQIVENGCDPSVVTETVNQVQGSQQLPIKLQNEKGQVLFTITGNFDKPEYKSLLQRLLANGDYQQLANRANLQTIVTSTANHQTVQTAQSPQAPTVITSPSTARALAQTPTIVNSPSSAQVLAQLVSQLGATSASTNAADPQNLNRILSQARISKEDLLKLIRSSRAGTSLQAQGQISNPQQPQGQKICQILQGAGTGAKTQQVINPLQLSAATQKVGTVLLPKQAGAATSLAGLIQSRANQSAAVGTVTTASHRVSVQQQQPLDPSGVKVIHVAPTTSVKQGVNVTNNQIISDLTLTSPQKVQTTIGSPRTATSVHQTVLLPNSGTQYFIVNQTSPVQNTNSQQGQQLSSVINSPKTGATSIPTLRLAGQVTQGPIRIIQTGPQATQVHTHLASPRFSTSQPSTQKIVLPQTLSSITSIVDNSNVTVSRGRPASVSPAGNVGSSTPQTGVSQCRILRPSGRGRRPIKRNYFVDPLLVKNKTATSSALVGPNSQQIITSVPNSQQLIIAGTQDPVQVLQVNAVQKMLSNGKGMVNHAANHAIVTVNNMGQRNSSSPAQGNTSLVEYSDSDSLSTSSEKDNESGEPPKLQASAGPKLSNGVVLMPSSLSDAIARAKPNEKIPVNTQSTNLKFIKNVVYNIPLKGEKKFYRFDGEYLVPEMDAGGMVGGGVGEKKEKTLRGNATGLHMSTPQANSATRTIMKAVEAVGSKVFKDGRFWKHSTGPQAIVGGTPTTIYEDGQGDTADSSSQANQGRKRPIEDVSDLPPIKDDEVRLVHCKFCGYTSYTVRSCERCHRTFQADTKIEVQKKKMKQDEGTVATSTISKQTFYGKPTMTTSTSVLYRTQVTGKDGNMIVLNYVNQGRRVNLDGKSYRSPSVIRGGKLPRKTYTSEPVTISISSDEEEETEKSSVPGSTATGSVSTPVAEKDDIGQLLDSIPQIKRPASPTAQVGSRVVKMEDEKGKTVLIRKSARRKSPTRPPSRGSTTNSPANNSSQSVASPEPVDVSSVNFIAKAIRIGSVPASPVEPVFLSEDSISFYVECENSSERFIIKPDELQQCMFCLENKPVIFLKTTPEFAERVRQLLKIEEKNENSWFDPNDAAMRYQFITITMVELGSLTYPKLNSVLSKYPHPKGQAFPFIVKMTGEEALIYQKEILGEGEEKEGEGQADPAPTTQLQPQPQERSPSPPKILFTGPVVKLITFPPPPAPGGIQVTNEDLSCLEEGEFLNDVIIDFYLKYLFLDVLSDRDRERTHVFSSFFFKRLTQRHGQRGVEADMADKTPAEKKHARVKNWTKKVDLFEKDFIIVPINEHSHWFLAVICFPGLQSIKRIPYIPKASNLVTQLTVEVQTLSTPRAKTAEERGAKQEEEPDNKGGPGKDGEPAKEPAPDKSLKWYKIPKLTKSGDDVKTDSESCNGPVNAVQDGEQGKDKEDGENGEETAEPMETEENELSNEQKRETEEDSEEMMDTSEATKSEDSQTDSEKSQSQCDSSSQSESQTKSESQIQTSTPTKEVMDKPVKLHFRAPIKDLRGTELTEEQMKDPDVLKKCTQGCRQPCILVFDSLAGQNRSRIVSILKEYLQVEWDTKKKTPFNLKEKIRGSTATKVPQQTNFSDCGVYILQYVESFFEDPIQDFSIPLKPLTGWFTEEKVTAKRKEIKELVMRLKETQEKGKS